MRMGMRLIVADYAEWSSTDCADFADFPYVRPATGRRPVEDRRGGPVGRKIVSSAQSVENTV
jgi:hypothetical protein